ncbi:MAG: hypothetical protein HYY24_01020 [Verrucomicrobia bacterium]|nr:hypothetical protein [Verrucomicrobiota bacterium]
MSTDSWAFRTRSLFRVALVASMAIASVRPSALGADALGLSVYATAGDVERHLATPAGRDKALAILQGLKISRLFLEGRRGDEYVSPARLAEVRDFFAAQGIAASGGIATVPGSQFGTRQNAPLGWLNWESEKTRRDIAGFFTENAPLFRELIVDDFYCTSDTSPESERARGQRSWSEYRRDLLVSLIDPLMVQPARTAQPSVRLILKFPQWYDRFHLFGYDPPRMAAPFDEIWVGTEVRDPKTRRMGFVQPTEGYMNFRWIASIAGEKVRGAWFDHIECSAQNFVDQAYWSVLAGARELTLFHLGDLMEGHPGDALLASRLPDLFDLAARVRGQRPDGIALYKPPGSDSDENMYLMDYLGMIGLPILPESRYPESARVAVLGVQAAADPEIRERMRRHLRAGATLVLTPAFVRRVGAAASELAGVETAMASEPAAATEARAGRATVQLAVPLEVDASMKATASRVLLTARIADRQVPLLTSRRRGGGRVLVLNVRTFSEADFRETGEWLLAPKPRGLTELPQQLADLLREALLGPLDVRLRAPTGVGLCLFGNARCLYNFRDHPVAVRLDGKRIELGANRWLWQAPRGAKRQP